MNAELQALARRVAALEKRSGSEALTPNYLTVDPGTGLVGADFTGTINAQGIILPAGLSNTPSPASRVEWQRQSDGAVVADIFGYLTEGLSLRAVSVNANGNSQILFQAVDDQGNVQASFTLTQQNRGATGSFAIVTGGETVTVLDNTGKSSFPRFPSLTTLRTQTLWGSLANGSVVPTATSSGGFSVARLAVGQYTVTFNQVFADTGYSAIATAASGYCTVNTRSAGHCQVNLFNAADALTDMAWAFIAIGVY